MGYESYHSTERNTTVDIPCRVGLGQYRPTGQCRLRQRCKYLPSRLPNHLFAFIISSSPVQRLISSTSPISSHHFTKTRCAHMFFIQKMTVEDQVLVLIQNLQYQEYTSDLLKQILLSIQIIFYYFGVLWLCFVQYGFFSIKMLKIGKPKSF